jgi:hypothetical protein
MSKKKNDLANKQIKYHVNHVIFPVILDFNHIAFCEIYIYL